MGATERGGHACTPSIWSLGTGLCAPLPRRLLHTAKLLQALEIPRRPQSRAHAPLVPTF